MTALNNSDAVPASRFADPGALGLGAFALTTFVLSMANANFIPGGAGAVLGLALFYGGATQLLAGLWEFARGNTFAATAFCSYGAFWMAAWFLLTVPSKADTAAGVGLFMLAWAIFTLYMTFAAIKTNMVILLVFIVLTLTLIALAIGYFQGDADGTGFLQIGGYLGILTALLAWYGSFATVMNATWKRVVLPVMPAK
jgi:uncharacterized protein